MAKKKAAKGTRTRRQPTPRNTVAKRAAPQKQCPKCRKDQPTATRKCSHCGYEFSKPAQRKGGSKARRTFNVEEIGQRLEMGRQLIEMSGGPSKATELLDLIDQLGGVDAAKGMVKLLQEQASKWKTVAGE